MNSCEILENRPVSNLAVVDTIINLHARGFNADFNLLGNQLFCTQTKCFLDEEQFDILEMFRFDDDSFCYEEAVIYAIECFETNIKGILLQVYNDRSPKIKGVLCRKISKFWL